MADDKPETPAQDPINNLPNTPAEASGRTRRNKQAYEEALHAENHTEEGNPPLHKGGSKGHRFN